MVHMGTKATHMAYPACEAVVMAHLVTLFGTKRCPRGDAKEMLQFHEMRHVLLLGEHVD